MDLFRTDNYLQDWNSAAKNRLILYLEQPVLFRGVEYPSGELLFLSYICKNPGITSSRLADTANRTRGTISIAMKKMAEKGLVVLEDAPFHRKKKLLYPTLLGKELYRHCLSEERKTLTELKNTLSEKYSESELSLIYSVLSDIIRFTIHKTGKKDP